MAICKISAGKSIHRLDATTFEKQKVDEGELRDFFARDDNIEAIEEDLMVVGKEVNVWQASRRIDLLCLDKKSNLVVFEFKRNPTGDYMEWQALRYAAMISAWSFDRLVQKYADYLLKRDREEVSSSMVKSSDKYQQIARENIEDFLGGIPDDDSFGSKVRIILVAAGFRKELTATVLWLNENDKLDIRCVEIPPFKGSDDTFFEVRTIIPLPVPKEYQGGIKEKKEKALTASAKRNYFKFNLTAGVHKYANLECNTLMLHLIRAVLQGDLGTEEKVEEIKTICAKAGRKVPVFRASNGNLTAEEMEKDIRKDSSDRRGRENRFYIKEDQLLRVDGKTYAISRGWYCDHAKKVAELLKEKFDFEALNISYEQVED